MQSLVAQFTFQWLGAKNRIKFIFHIVELKFKDLCWKAANYFQMFELQLYTDANYIESWYSC